MVEVIDGPFSSFKGKITKLDTDRERVKLEVAIFGRATDVDLTMSQIKKI
jgi:transcriptional antiterminator NusG